MAKTVLLIGHCGPDVTYLRMALRAAAPEATIISVDGDDQLPRLLAGADAALVNRELDGDFNEAGGVELIKRLRPLYPAVKFILISNYADAQAAARAAGAMPGFGKRDIGSPVATNILISALKDDT